ncbi:KinB-signaling pathway activation protein [Paenibacillus sp. FSL W8-0186]|uniref:KinB-signaling pathway activation protein n=1 Tax=Paenibacillus woosongensis TaxID=307580 RepID=A0A7X2Z5N4_9BACL|nr:KinB-signaling pathway activation protein [Paenibacillus woosongensis]MUG47960.1 KinB signaling pathway activation protein [Paenibacillus woosongensis]GIP61164.1 KinB-signaling pathway activation protein [Paenibacillus woosongensis]
MNLKNWLYLFWTTLLVGAVGSLAVGLILQWTDTVQLNGAVDFLVNVGILLGVGIMVSVYSQMGFFAYLMINYMGTGVFTRRTWQYVQIVLTALALLELMFFRTFVGEGQGGSDIVLSAVILIVACAVAFYKAKLTNGTAWIPTLFFMIAVTIVEMIGVLKIGVNAATAWIVAPLLACNAYQILILHKVLKPAAPAGSAQSPQ